jgi:HKD family nuclease
MKATFLGHGLDSGDKPNVGKQLAISLESADYNIFNGFIAFASISGVKMLQPFLKKAKEYYKHIRFYIGVDNRGTSKEALESLLNQNIETYIYHDEKNFITYHPKLFLFEGPIFSRVIIGSSNLTSQGIKTNLEASIQLDFRSKTDTQGINLVKEIKEYYSNLLDLSSSKLKVLTADLLQKLIEDNLLFTQFFPNQKPKEPKNNDGENQDDVEVTDFDIKSGFEQKKTTRKPSTKSFNKEDYENFETLLNRYVIYKRDERPSGIVSKQTQDRELLYWYRKMNALNNIDAIPSEILNKLNEIDFPFAGSGIEKKRLIKWDKDFEKLIDYKNKVNPNSKRTHVPQFTNKSNPYYHLATWCAAQKQRRKGNYTPLWTLYEEEKMNSINFLWDASIAGSRPKDEIWTDNLVELEKYYSKKKNVLTVPSQETTLGHWLNDQMTLKTRQERENRNDLISQIRIDLLDDLLQKNGIEWEWEKQKHRIGIEKKINSWRKVEELKRNGKIKSLSDKEKKELKKMRDDVAQLRSQSKKWNNDKNRWKYGILDKVGFPYDKPENASL